MALGAFTAGMYKIRSEGYPDPRLRRRAKRILLFLFGYFILNMALLFVSFSGGSPEVVNGSYRLSNHGKLIRYLSKDEYQQSLMLELRFFTSGWLVGYAAVLTYLSALWVGLRPGFREIHWGPES